MAEPREFIVETLAGPVRCLEDRYCPQGTTYLVKGGWLVFPVGMPESEVMDRAYEQAVKRYEKTGQRHREFTPFTTITGDFNELADWIPRVPDGYSFRMHHRFGTIGDLAPPTFPVTVTAVDEENGSITLDTHRYPAVEVSRESMQAARDDVAAVARVYTGPRHEICYLCTARASRLLPLSDVPVCDSCAEIHCKPKERK